MFVIIIVYVLFTKISVNAYNILVWNPTIAHSHISFMGRIADVLSADGQNVTIFSPSIETNKTYFGNQLPAHTIRYAPRKTDDEYLERFTETSMWEAPPCSGVCSDWSALDMIYDLTLRYCKDLLEDEAMMNRLNTSKFELAFIEVLDTCAPGIIEILKIKHIILLSGGHVLPRLYEVAGMAALPSFEPGVITPYSDEMTFMERFRNLKTSLQWKFHTERWEHEFWKVFDRKHPGFPSIENIYFEKTALIMTNTNEFVESPRPRTNMIRYIGGAAQPDPKPLSEELNELLNVREETVLFSMGSIAQSKSMPLWLKNDVLKTFASFPNVTFIWKYEGDDLPFNDYQNVYPMKWIPQIDLMADERLSLFITHGGINSFMEALQYGKPMIVIPLFADQRHNSKNIERRGIGTVIERHELNRESLTKAIQKTLYSEEIRREAAFAAYMLTNRPQFYRSEIARWAKITIEYGRMDHFVLHSRNMSFITYFCLDVIGCIIFVAFILISSLFYLLKQVLFLVLHFKFKKD